MTRLGDWVEVGNELYINFIASTRIHYQWTDNYDFESDIQDRVPNRSNTSTVPHDGDGDLSFQESRLSLDLRYQKNLRARILLENQMTWDGNRIDNGFDLDGDSPATQTFRDGNNLSCQSASAAEGSPQPVSSSCLQRNTVNLERAWIEYTFPGTPITFDVGARIRSYDPGRMLGDDDPGIRVIARFGPEKELRLSAAAIIQTESLRIGLQNDNDDVYYVFEGSYNRKPYQVGMSVAYFRFRFRGATGQSLAGQKVDSVMFTPYVTGTIGPFRGLIQPMFVFGSADGSDATGNIDYDIASFGLVAAVHVNQRE